MKELDQDKAFDEMETTLIALLARGETVESAAEMVGISERTVYRRKENPEFRAKVAEFRAKMFSSAAGQLLEVMQVASDKLQLLMDDADPHVQFKAAVKLLEFAFKVREIDERDLGAQKLKIIVSNPTELPERTENVLPERPAPQLPELGSPPRLHETQDDGEVHSPRHDK
jgi:transposase